jgi:TolA-binding protein
LARFNKIFLLIIGITILSACTTQKRKGDVGKVAKFYHNTTAEFNGYFNANELFEESIVQLNEDYQDNYNKILPVFEYVATDNPKAVADNLDNAIEKVSIVVALHRVSDWTDDCYLLLGKSQYVKQDYESAEETLEYLRAEYNPETLAKKQKKAKKGKKTKKQSSKKRKKAAKERKKKAAKASKKRKAANKKARKKKNKSSKKKKKSSSAKKEKTPEKTVTPKSDLPSTKEKSKKKEVEKENENDPKPDDGGIFKRPPAYQEGLLWLARTYIERENFDEAASILNELDADPNTLDDVKRQLGPVQAHFFLVQKEYDKVIAPLEMAIDKSKKKEEKARYAYIIAQIHQNAGRGKESYAFYEKVDKYSNSYEMRFSAKLKMALNEYINGNATADQITKDLEKMAKDIKNEEYLDQIYYTLADIALKANNKSEAITYLKKSLQFSNDKSAQRPEAYYRLADLYYENQDFVNAKNYFDSTLLVLPKTDERYDRVSAFSDNLKEIAENIIIIQEQDSLLTISKLSDKDKEALAYQIRKQQEEDRINNLKNAVNKPGDKFKTNSRIQTKRPGDRSTPSTFFAYNERTVKKGKKDFQKRWDNRPLEDDWRRANRRGAGDEIINEIVVEDVPLGALTEEDINKLLKDVPNTPQEIKIAEDKIIDAMFILGSLYRDRLQLNNKTVEILEELDTRFPGNKHELDSWYFLYLSHTDLGNITKAKEYYDKIVNKYPNTTYARVLQDPNFLENSKEEERKLTIYYNQTYNAFENGKYDDAAQRAVKAVELFGPTNVLQPRFALLNAMCLGNLQGVDAYKKELRDIISKYPDTPEQTRAREILRLLGGEGISVEDREKVGGENKKNKDESNFKVDDNKMHYCIVVLKNNSVNLTEAKAAVSDYHSQYHKIDKLRIANVYLGADTSTPILVIRRFKSKDLAMGYYNGVLQNSVNFLPSNAEYEIYPITQFNYRQVLKNKELDSYKAFFQENY